jgi:hypothetical protein
VTEVVVHFVFPPDGYRLLGAAIRAADLAEKERLPSFDDYARGIERDERGFERDGVSFRRRALSVEAMLRWLDGEGLLPDRRGRERYVRAIYGENPLRKRYRKGMLLAFGDGGDTRWDGEPEASNTNDWFAKLDGQRRAAAARAREGDGEYYSPWGNWRAVWRPGS